MKNTVIAVAIGLSLSACGGESKFGRSQTVNETEADQLDIGAATDTQVDTDQMTEVEDTEAPTPLNEVVPVIATNSEDLSVSKTFSFETARTVDIDFDLELARNELSSVSICTSFDPNGDAYGVDYDSCTVQGQMIDGIFHHSMEVTNDITSVAGIVWFQDSSRAPLMQIFPVVQHTEQTTSRSLKDRGVMSSNRVPKIVWR